LLILWEVFNLALEHLGYTHAATEVIGIVVDLWFVLASCSPDWNALWFVHYLQSLMHVLMICHL